MLLLLQGPVTAQQTTVKNSAQAEAAVQQARAKNRQYWKTVKLVSLGGLVAALVLMQRRRKR